MLQRSKNYAQPAFSSTWRRIHHVGCSGEVQTSGLWGSKRVYTEKLRARQLMCAALFHSCFPSRPPTQAPGVPKNKGIPGTPAYQQEVSPSSLETKISGHVWKVASSTVTWMKLGLHKMAEHSLLHIAPSILVSTHLTVEMAEANMLVIIPVGEDDGLLNLTPVFLLTNVY